MTGTAPLNRGPGRMAGAPHHPRRRVSAAVAVALVAATVAGCGTSAGPRAGATTTSTVATGAGPSTVPVPPAAAGPTSADPFADLPGPQPLPSQAAVTATRITVPAMGVDSSLEQLSVGGDHVLQAPVDPRLAGWYSGGTVPGDPGPAVIAGHVDSTSGPAVFYELKQLKVGSVVAVTRSDGRTVRFRVDGVDQYPKDDFPTEAVYGPTPDPSLRLITCGGTFDYGRHHYRDNVVAYASLIS